MPHRAAITKTQEYRFIDVTLRRLFRGRASKADTHAVRQPINIRSSRRLLHRGCPDRLFRPGRRRRRHEPAYRTRHVEPVEIDGKTYVVRAYSSAFKWACSENGRGLCDRLDVRGGPNPAQGSCIMLAVHDMVEWRRRLECGTMICVNTTHDPSTSQRAPSASSWGAGRRGTRSPISAGSCRRGVAL